MTCRFHVVAVHIALALIDLEDGVEVGLGCFDAMRLHPRPNQVLLLSAYVTELVKVVP